MTLALIFWSAGLLLGLALVGWFTDTADRMDAFLVTEAARAGREATDMTAHDTRETDDGLVEHRALFTVKELDR